MKQLIDLNNDKTNFSLKFKVECKTPDEFDMLVVDQTTLDNVPALEYKRMKGQITGDIVDNKNVYQNYFLILKSDTPCDVEVTVDINDVPPGIPQSSQETVQQPPSQQQPNNTQPQQHNNIAQGSNNYTTQSRQQNSQQQMHQLPKQDLNNTGTKSYVKIIIIVVVLASVCFALYFFYFRKMGVGVTSQEMLLPAAVTTKILSTTTNDSIGEGSYLTKGTTPNIPLDLSANVIPQISQPPTSATLASSLPSKIINRDLISKFNNINF